MGKSPPAGGNGAMTNDMRRCRMRTPLTGGRVLKGRSRDQEQDPGSPGGGIELSSVLGSCSVNYARSSLSQDEGEDECHRPSMKAVIRFSGERKSKSEPRFREEHELQ